MESRRLWPLVSLIVAVLAADVIAIATRPSQTDPSARPTLRASVGRVGDDAAGSGTSDESSPKVRPADGSSVAASRRVMPPVAGAYRYRSRTTITPATGAPTTSDGVATYTFTAAVRSGSSYTQVVRIADGTARQSRTNRWSPGGLYRVKDSTSSGAPCTYDPARLAVRFPLRLGDEWKLGAPACREPAEPGYRVTGSERHRMVRTEDVTVGGTAVRCYVIESVLITTSTSPNGTLSSRAEQTQWFSPDYGLFLRVHRTTAAEARPSAPGAQPTYSTTTSTAELLDLKPA